ncbi:MAG: hypothetical protein P4L83_23310 [Nevskia sp.]|nr:hypothetical protein [Nevskia sp.]
MKYLLYLDAALTALGVAMSVSIGFVCLVYALHLGESQFRNSFSNLLAISACFVTLAVVAGCATYALWKRRRWNWAAQGALAALLPTLYLIVRARLDTP